MDFLVELFMEVIPDAFMEFIGNPFLGRVKARVHNRFLRGLLCALIVVGIALIGVLITLGILLLLGILKF